MRITLIEDSPETLNKLVAALSKRKVIFEIQFICTSPFFERTIEAKIAEFHPNLIVLDLLLVESSESGFRVLARLKESSLLKDVPVIVCSKYIDEDSDAGRKYKDKALALGAADAVTKIPFPLADYFLSYAKQGEPLGP